MSINVTVTGNPVSINRGRMVTSCPYNDAPKEEFDRRRLMRLEQVRQQSKEIAENVRNKVRNEKKKQCNLFEKESEKKLKDWQARKLLELHNQYQQSLRDIGLGHKEAEVFDGIEEDLKTQKDYQAKVAAERGRLARERQQNFKSSSAPIQSRRPLTKNVKSAQETRTGAYDQNKWGECCPKKHFYTLVDKSGEGTPIQVTPRTGTVSEESSSSAAKKLTDENGTDGLEETSSSSSENGISGGSSPRSLVHHISPQTSAGDAVERLIGSRSSARPTRDSSDLQIKFKSKIQEQASVNVLGRSYGASGRFASQQDASRRFRGDTIEELAAQRTASSLQKGKGSRLIPGSRTKGYSARFEQGGATGKSGGKSLARITEESLEQDPSDDEARPTKSRSKSREKSLRKVGESRTKQFEQEGLSKSRLQRVSEKEKSLGRVKSSRTGPQTEQDEDTGDEMPAKSRSQKVSSKNLARSRPGQQENDSADDDSEILEGRSKHRSQRSKSRQKVPDSRTKQSAAMGDFLEQSGKLQKSRQSKAKSLGKVAGGQEQDEDTEDEATEMPGKPSKSRSQKVRRSRPGQQENDSIDDDSEIPESPSKAKSRQKAAMDDLEESESLSKSRKSKVKSLGKVAGQDKDTVDEDERPSKSKSVAQKSKSKAKSLGKVAGQDEDTVDEDEGPLKSRSVAQKSKSMAKSVGKVAGQDEDTVDEDEGPSKSRSVAQKIKSKAKSLGKVAGQDEDTVDEDEGPSKSRSVAQKIKSKAKSLGKVAGQDEDTVDEDEGPSKSRSVVQKGKSKEKGLRKVTETDQEDDTVDEDLEVHEGRAKARSQKITAGKGKEKSAGRVAKEYEGDEITVDGKRLSGERGDNKKESQVIREPSVRHARSLSEPTTQHSSLKYPVETRISDRIKHRSAVVTNPDLCDTISDEVLIKETSRHSIRSNPDLPKPVEHKDTDIQVAPTVAQKEQSTSLDGAGESGEIPEKPTVVLKQKPSAKGGVERIDEGDLVVVAEYGEGDDFSKRMERQDREAEERGKVAMQKEKTRRSYEEMMRKLPVVQKQERLSRLTVQKPEYYMSEGRLKEVERKKQFEMENAYESAFPGLKPSLITTKEVARGEKVDKEPFKVVDKAQGVQVGSWDVLKKHGRCVCCPSQTNRERHLKDLLLNLQTQKELLLHEVDSLPKDSKLNELLGSLHNMSGDRKQPEKKRVVSPTSTSSSSPRKKPKMKCKRSVLVLQNISTQTSPSTKAVEKVEKATSPRQKSPERVEEKVEKAISKICGCKATETCGHGAAKPTNQVVVEDEKLCEIVIKIRENESQPEIFVEKSSNKKAVGDVEVKVKKPKKVDAKPKADQKRGTWRERLSQHSTSSSTSYYSPPDVSVRKHQPRLRDVLQDKQQQTNFGARSTTPCRTTQTGRKLHPFIVKYIDRLLTISRSAVEDMSVSSVSDVTTPASSITEISSNNPSLVHLRKLLKRLGITYDELHEIYGKSGKHNAVLSSLSSASTHSNENDLNQGRVESCGCDTQDERTNTSLSARVSQEEVVEEDDEKYREMMMKYAEITESCNKKISDLTEKIEKVRMEKMQIMNSADSSGGGTEKENTTTAYLDPPNTETNTSSNTTAEQEKLDNILSTIDQSLAESLKRMTSSEIREKYPDKDIHPIEEIPPTTTTEDFEPLLKDIPKLPKLSELCDPLKCCRRPPPSKGLTVAKRFNDEITAVPHELSTILEGDSHHSNKQLKFAEDQPTETKKPTTSNCEVQVQHKSSSSDELESLEKMLKDMGMGWAIATLRKTQETLALTSSSSSLDINIQQQKGVISDSSGSASEISLKGVLSRHLLAKISSTSSSTSETSISLLLKEFEDISAIFGSGSTARDGRRTSTPIQPITSKSKQCNCGSDRSGGSINKASCTFHSLHSNGSV